MKTSKNSNCMWRVLPLCLFLLATGLISCSNNLESCSNNLEAGEDEDWHYLPIFDFSKTMDEVEANLIEKEELPEWLIPIVSEREEKDSSTAVFTGEMNGKLVYNIYYFSKGLFTMNIWSSRLKFDDLYYSDGTLVPFMIGAEQPIRYEPEKWRMIYCARPELYLQPKQKRQELVEKDELPDWLVSKIDSCKAAIITLQTRDDQQAYYFYGTLKQAYITDRSVLIGTYFPDGTRCTSEESMYFGRSADQCVIYLQEAE